MQIISDDDFAVFVGTSTTIGRLVYQNNTSIPTQLTDLLGFSFSLQEGETTVYLLAMGGGGSENVGGYINDVDITSIAVDQSSDLSSFLTGYTAGLSSVADGTFNATLTDVQTARPGLTWGPSPVVVMGEGAMVTGSAFRHDTETAVFYRMDAEDLNIEPAPEPSSTLLAALAGVSILIRRRRKRLA